MITPRPPSGLPAPSALRKEVTVSLGSSAALAAPVRIGEVMFIGCSRGCLMAGSRPEPSEFSIVGRQALSCGSNGSGGGSSGPGQADLSGEGGLVIALRRGAGSGGDSHVGSNGFAAGLRSGRAHFLSDAMDGDRPHKGGEGPGNQREGHRGGTAEISGPGGPDRQLLQQSVRSTPPVLLPDRAGAAAAAG